MKRLYTYAIAVIKPLLPDEPDHCGPTLDLSAEEAEAMGLVNLPYQDADDLPDGTKFADVEIDGERCRAFRIAAD